MKRIDKLIGKEITVQFEDKGLPMTGVVGVEKYPEKQGGNNYFLKTPQGVTRKIYSRGKRRIAKREDGTYVQKYRNRYVKMSQSNTRIIGVQ